MRLTMEQYFGRWINSPDVTPSRTANAAHLIDQCNKLIVLAEAGGVKFLDNPHTECCVSGETFGGFRPQSCAQGAPNSAHKEGMAVDLFDPRGEIDAWCMAHQDQLKELGIYMEHPDATVGWSHWGTRAPLSGHTVFYP